MQRNDSLYYDDSKRNSEEPLAYYTGYNSCDNCTNPTEKKSNMSYTDESNKSRSYLYDDEYLNRDYSNSSGKAVQKKKEYKTPKQSLIIMQLIACALVIAGILTVKNFFPDYYEVFCDWYNSEINKSIITESTDQSSSKSDTVSQDNQISSAIQTNSISLSHNAEVKVLL